MLSLYNVVSDTNFHKQESVYRYRLPALTGRTEKKRFLIRFLLSYTLKHVCKIMSHRSSSSSVWRHVEKHGEIIICLKCDLSLIITKGNNPMNIFQERFLKRVPERFGSKLKQKNEYCPILLVVKTIGPWFHYRQRKKTRSNICLSW